MTSECVPLHWPDFTVPHWPWNSGGGWSQEWSNFVLEHLWLCWKSVWHLAFIVVFNLWSLGWPALTRYHVARVAAGWIDHARYDWASCIGFCLRDKRLSCLIPCWLPNLFWGHSGLQLAFDDDGESSTGVCPGSTCLFGAGSWNVAWKVCEAWDTVLPVPKDHVMEKKLINIASSRP